HDRLASPLILRPLAVQGGKAVGLAAVLEGASDPVHLDLTLNTRQGAPRTWAGLKADLAAREAASITDANGNPHLGTHSDVVAAFLDTL
ncbi:MAG: type III-B CRISPR module RAMP protein Cmr1, partial [Armatimonadetes bacterium CG_4_10_14_3_um_filter_59_10]